MHKSFLHFDLYLFWFALNLFLGMSSFALYGNHFSRYSVICYLDIVALTVVH